MLPAAIPVCELVGVIVGAVVVRTVKKSLE